MEQLMLQLKARGVRESCNRRRGVEHPPGVAEAVRTQRGLEAEALPAAAGQNECTTDRVREVQSQRLKRRCIPPGAVHESKSCPACSVGGGVARLPAGAGRWAEAC